MLGAGRMPGQTAMKEFDISFPERLSREIARVAALRERYQAMDRMPQVNVKPVITLIDAALEAAHKAIGEGDIAAQVVAIGALEAFTK